MHVEVLGRVGCPRCGQTVRVLENAARRLGGDGVIQKVEDMRSIAGRGALTTPAVVIDRRRCRRGRFLRSTRPSSRSARPSLGTPAGQCLGSSSVDDGLNRWLRGFRHRDWGRRALPLYAVMATRLLAVEGLGRASR